MVVPTPNVIAGIILPDGSLQLAHAIGLPPGPVQVVLRQIESPTECRPTTPAETITAYDRLPDLLEDPCIPAPYDLPRDGPFVRIYPRYVEEYLPEPHDIDESMK